MFAENTEGSNITGSAASMCRGTGRLECYVGSRDLLAREQLERAVNAVTQGLFGSFIAKKCTERPGLARVWCSMPASAALASRIV